MGPRETLALVAAQLDFDDDREHGLAKCEEDDEICVELGRLGLGEVRGLDPRLGVFGDGDLERVSEQLNRELGPFAEEQQQRFVEV